MQPHKLASVFLKVQKSPSSQGKLFFLSFLRQQPWGPQWLQSAKSRASHPKNHAIKPSTRPLTSAGILRKGIQKRAGFTISCNVEKERRFVCHGLPRRGLGVTPGLLRASKNRSGNRCCSSRVGARSLGTHSGTSSPWWQERPEGVLSYSIKRS